MNNTLRERVARLARSLLRPDREGAIRRRLEQRELESSVIEARPYAGLASTSLTLASLVVDSSAARSINVLLGEVREDRMFAGIHTALSFAVSLANTQHRALRVVMLDVLSPGNSADAARAYIEREFAPSELSVVTRDAIPSTRFGSDDLWIATHFWTAHAASVASAVGLIDPGRVIYLIQDYEPGFSPWSTTSTIAQATYHAGFLPVVNSKPLARYLVRAEGVEIDETLVFSPAFDLGRLERAAASRGEHTPTLMFYARPSKPRNLYVLGVAALRAAVAELGPAAGSVRFVSTGEPHPDVDLGSGVTLRSLGRLGWDRYFEFLGECSVVLSLQASAHPSHPPFDAAVSGALAITNEFSDTRAGLHPRLNAVAADVPALAAAIVAAVRATSAPGEYLPVAPGLLGRPMNEVVEAVATRFATR